MQKFNGNDSEIKIKPALTQFRRSGSYEEGGKIIKGALVEEELHIDAFEGEGAMDTLLAGFSQEDINVGREKLASEHPELASQHMNDYMDKAAESLTFEDASRFNDPKQAASTKRVGMIMDGETGDTINFRRVKGTGQVELSMDDGEVIDTLASTDFDELLDTGTYRVL